jgi:hypothetical protein
MASSESFITGVDAGGSKLERPNSRLSRTVEKKVEVLPPRIISDHKKLDEVVDSFRKKVDLMVMKQRAEYEEAYEHHMEGVQKELHFLREKAKEIANDKTKEEKINQLDSDQQFYSNECVRLDAETNELRKRLRRIAGDVHVVERERDWLLGKLRNAKVEYKDMARQRSILMETFEESMGMSKSLASEDSSMTLEIARKKQQQLQLGGGGNKNTRINTTGGGLLAPIGGSVGNNDHHAIEIQAKSKLQKKLERDLHRSKSTLVMIKTKQEQLRKFVSEALSQVQHRNWDRFFRTDTEGFTASIITDPMDKKNLSDRPIVSEQMEKRPLDELLSDCHKAVAVESREGSDLLRSMLSVELSLVPNVYEIILGLISVDPMSGVGAVESSTNTNGFNKLDAELLDSGIAYDLIGPDAGDPNRLLEISMKWDPSGQLIEEEKEEKEKEKIIEPEVEIVKHADINPWNYQQKGMIPSASAPLLTNSKPVSLSRDISAYFELSNEHRLREVERRKEELEEEAAEQEEMRELNEFRATIA